MSLIRPVRRRQDPLALAVREHLKLEEDELGPLVAALRRLGVKEAEVPIEGADDGQSLAVWQRGGARILGTG